MKRTTDKCGKIWRLLQITICMMVALWVGISSGTDCKVYAAEGAVSFGSESYQWKTGDVCPIGVYFKSQYMVKSYSICLEYDSSKLSYLNGADRVEGNLIYLEGGGEANEYKRMLHFEPIEAGETALYIKAATGVGAIAHEDESVIEEELVIPLLGQVPVSIQQKGSSRLLELMVTGAEGMETFEPDTVEYHMQVDNAMERLEIQYVTEDETAVVETSEQQLEVGTNIITVRVQGEDVEPIIYILYVERREPEVVMAENEQEVVDIEAGVEIVNTEKEPEIDTGVALEVDAKIEPEIEEEVDEEVELVPQPEEMPDPILGIAAILVGIYAVVYVILRMKEQKIYKQKEANSSNVDENIRFINLEQTVIEVQNVTMRFKQAQDEASSLKEYIIRVLKRQNQYHMLTALKDISFEVKQGDVLGIVGTNGSGKSTLLKIIAGALHPSDGKVLVDKSKVQMLTLGTGFDMELTAKENVYLNGAIIGYTKEYIDEKYDDIVAFAELEGFMEERMKNFSSGMVSRLAFAIATMRNAPDILILDEVLSVGDMFFRKKSEKRIKEMIHSGATVLIVSHSADVIRKNCDKAIWIEKGELRMIGHPADVCKAYEGMKNEA